MPRLTHSTYIYQRNNLQVVWRKAPDLYSYLGSPDQLALHQYFLFALDKTDAELRTHRHNVKLGDPSLANRAGKAYARLMRGEWRTLNTRTTANRRHLSIRSLMRPEPDTKLLARAFIGLAIQEVRKSGAEVV